VRNGACAAAFEIIELDPATMSTRRLLAHKGAPMGAATVAQRVGDALYIGSFAGDRLLRVEPSQAALTPLVLQNP
jgi:hypothetical protein